MVQNVGGIKIPDGVNPAAFESGDISFLSGRSQVPGFIDLSPAEIAIFDADLRRLAYMSALERDLSALLTSQRDALLFAASILKSSFKGLTFGGLLGGGGFNMQLVRPITILSSVPVAQGGGGGTAVQTWKRTFTTTGWQALFGNDSNQVSLGVTGSSTTAVTTYSRVGLAVPYILSTGASPKFVEIRPRVLTTGYPVYPLHWMRMSDLFVAKLPGILLALANDYFDIEANIDTTGDDAPSLFGVQFVTNDYAVLES
jgi:hypothetical protein